MDKPLSPDNGEFSGLHRCVSYIHENKNHGAILIHISKWNKPIWKVYNTMWVLLYNILNTEKLWRLFKRSVIVRAWESKGCIIESCWKWRARVMGPCFFSFLFFFLNLLCNSGDLCLDSGIHIKKKTRCSLMYAYNPSSVWGEEKRASRACWPPAWLKKNVHRLRSDPTSKE